MLGGNRDLVLDSYLGWSGGETLPVTLSANAKTLLLSNLPRGTFVYLQALHTRELLRRGAVRVSAAHGPAYVYSCGLYMAAAGTAFFATAAPSPSRADKPAARPPGQRLLEREHPQALRPLKNQRVH